MSERRLLSNDEVELVAWLLRRDFPGAQALRDQMPFTSVDGAWAPGSASLNLTVQRHVPRSTFADGPVPGQVWAHGPSGDPVGTVLLWVTDGYLSAIEYGWVTDEPPTALPTVNALRDHSSG